MPCDFCVLRARSLVFLSCFGFTSQQYTKFKYFFVFADRAGVENQSRGDSQTKDRKTPKTRRKRLSFRNGLGTVRGVYEATSPSPCGHNGGRHLWGAQNFILAKYRFCPPY